MISTLALCMIFLSRSPDSPVWHNRERLASHQTEHRLQVSHSMAAATTGHAPHSQSFPGQVPGHLRQHQQPHGGPERQRGRFYGSRWRASHTSGGLQWEPCCMVRSSQSLLERTEAPADSWFLLLVWLLQNPSTKTETPISSPDQRKVLFMEWSMV